MPKFTTKAIHSGCTDGRTADGPTLFIEMLRILKIEKFKEMYNLQTTHIARNAL